MKRKFLFSLFFTVLFFSNSVFSQIMIKAKPGEMINLAEIGSIVLQKDDKIVVEFVMPKDSRPKGYDMVDIQQGDVIFMVNGKKIKHVKELTGIYENLKTGENLKIAVKRGDNKRMLWFSKADPENLPKRKMVKMTVGEDGKKKVESENMSDEELKKVMKEKNLQDRKVILEKDKE